MRFTLPLFAAILAVVSPQLTASPLKSAAVTVIVNDVNVLGSHGIRRRAAERQILDGDASLGTGAQSRAEFIFADRTVVRLGAETSVALHPGTRELSLNHGTLLLQVPKFHGAVRIRAGSLTVECGGATIIAEHLPGGSLKAVVLAGEMRAFAPGFLGDSIVIPAGKMLITRPDARRIPEPVDTDIRTIVKTSALINPATFGTEYRRFAPLPSLPLITREIARQDEAFKKKRLIRTNLVIFGSGTKVVIPTVGDAEVANGQNVSTIDRKREKMAATLIEQAPPLVVGRPQAPGEVSLEP